MSNNGNGMGISPVLLQAIAQTLSSGGNGVMSPKSNEVTTSNPVLNSQPVIALKDGQTLIIVQNYRSEDARLDDSGSTGERSEGESGDAVGNRSAAEMVWGSVQQKMMMPGRSFQLVKTGIHPNDGLTLLVQSNDGVTMTSPLSTDNLQGGNSKHSSTESYEPCPICGDKISGYHYGIYSCESCKGFFKRTVQNGKSFACRQKGECSIVIANRKKCPACRFVKCRMAGMRLEAIRPDRTRGGRSNYEGCFTRPSPNVNSEKIVLQSSLVPLPLPSQPKRQALVGSIPRLVKVPPPPPNPLPSSSSSSSPPPLCFSIVPRPGMPSSPCKPPETMALPQALEDLLAIESLMEDNEDDAEIESRMQYSDQDPFVSLFHMIDHCLYKIVRWARNRPDFANITTDDQILLLQNCWAELLFMNCCWKSLKVEDGIHVGRNHVLTMAESKEMDVDKVVQRLLDYTQFLRTYQVDVYEIVAMKTLLLLSPDVDNLSDPESVRIFQEQLLDIFMTYTSDRYPSMPNKFGHLLAKQAEMSRTCYLAKELLVPHEKSGKIPMQSLLHELLKGDVGLH